jgi:hypothetical protein
VSGVCGVTSVSIPYSISQTAPIGSQSLTLSNRFGTSNGATFNVAAPTGVTVEAATSSVNVFYNSRLGSVIAFQNSPSVGISLLAQSTGKDSLGNNVAASGSYQWVQLINTEMQQYLAAPSPWVYACTVFTDAGLANGTCQVMENPSKTTFSPELDGSYPYSLAIGTNNVLTTDVANDTALDSPSVPLYPSQGERQVYVNYTMYLEWIPSAGNACTTSGATGCTIPVPLASGSWFWDGDAVNTQATQPAPNGTTYVRSCGNCSQGSNNYFQQANPNAPNYSYVSWQYKVPPKPSRNELPPQ